MFRKLVLFPAAFAASLMMIGAAAAQGYTTRIETRPFYGAVVTLEDGVRVIRPLPPERQVIINPDGRTPLYLGFSDTHIYDNRAVRNTTSNAGDGAPYGRILHGTSRAYGPGLGGYGHMSHTNAGVSGHSPAGE